MEGGWKCPVAAFGVSRFAPLDSSVSGFVSLQSSDCVLSVDE
jgi:hypothetical protein